MNKRQIVIVYTYLFIARKLSLCSGWCYFAKLDSISAKFFAESIFLVRSCEVMITASKHFFALYTQPSVSDPDTNTITEVLGWRIACILLVCEMLSWGFDRLSPDNSNRRPGHTRSVTQLWKWINFWETHFYEDMYFVITSFIRQIEEEEVVH